MRYGVPAKEFQQFNERERDLAHTRHAISLQLDKARGLSLDPRKPSCRMGVKGADGVFSQCMSQTHLTSQCPHATDSVVQLTNVDDPELLATFNEVQAGLVADAPPFHSVPAHVNVDGPDGAQLDTPAVSTVLSEDFVFTVGAVIVLLAAIAALAQPMIVFSDAQPAVYGPHKTVFPPPPPMPRLVQEWEAAGADGAAKFSTEVVVLYTALVFVISAAVQSTVGVLTPQRLKHLVTAYAPASHALARERRPAADDAILYVSTMTASFVRNSLSVFCSVATSLPGMMLLLAHTASASPVSTSAILFTIPPVQLIDVVYYGGLLLVIAEALYFLVVTRYRPRLVRTFLVVDIFRSIL
jgi:hypothetical protein